MLYPFTFRPICMERVWGGRRLAELFGKELPPEVPIGETWEISDLPGAISEITNGPLAGRNLRWLMENHATDLLGEADDLHGERIRGIDGAFTAPGDRERAAALFALDLESRYLEATVDCDVLDHEPIEQLGTGD